MKNQLHIATLLKELRGSRTQAEMSKALGYKFNQYFKWESGTTEISFENFIQLCDYAHAPLLNILDSLLHYTEDRIEQKELLKQLLSYWCNNDEENFLKASSFSKSKWWRLKSGKSKLSLDDFLEIINIMARKKDPFLKLISKKFKDKKHLQPKLNEQVLLETIRNYPEFIDIYSCLFLADFAKSKTYSTRRNLILKTTKLEPHRLDRVLQQLKDLKILDITQKDLEEPFKLAISKINVDVHQILTRYCLKKHLLTKNELDARGRTGTTSIIGAVSEETEKKVLSLLTQCFHEIVKLMSIEDPDKKSKLAYIYLGTTS